MTITINHQQSGRHQGHNRRVVAAIGVALVVSLAVVVQATTSRSAPESTRDLATDQVFDLDQARSAETARLVSINEIPWAPTASATDARAAETARLVSINEIPWAPAESDAATQADAADQAFFLSINDAGEPITLGAAPADGGLAFFLSINDVDG